MVIPQTPKLGKSKENSTDAKPWKFHRKWRALRNVDFSKSIRKNSIKSLLKETSVSAQVLCNSPEAVLVECSFARGKVFHGLN